eukprot:NODE_2260_length_809_cov_378.531579_g1577_i0.p1 GENE.NODE_2260_length_809_cov_378.531579_g1577_i0~~NODE_2260_length_809_cov_378.531579_g1577_i0.p1  ORF type:complete len:208 (+),score=52.82 NODE_2260_length_809_cov_378.531579_g1577_i0:75-698(+)
MRRATLSRDVYKDVYEESLIPKMEENVATQLKDNTYDFEANLHLLKLYQLFPGKGHSDGIRKVLLKALMHLKENAFNLSMYLIPEKVHADPVVDTLSKLATLLEVAKFDDFWKKAESQKEILSAATGFNHSIRDFIMDILLITYRTVDLAFLSEALNLKETDLKTYLHMKGMRAEGSHVAFPETEFTTLKQRAAPQNIQFEQIQKIF